MLQIRLKELRDKKGISQASLANELGIRQSTVGMWESGKNKPQPDMLVTLSKYFGVSVDYLLGIDDEDEEMNENLRGRADRGKSDDIMIFGYGKGAIHIPKEKQEKLKKLLEAADLVDESDFLP